MEIANNLNTEKTILNNEINGKVQNNFLESTLGKTINAAVNIGLRWALPDLIEDEVINIKNSLIKGGLKEGINTAVSSAIDLGKSAMGIFTGNFESISQAQNAVKTGGVIDGISNVIDTVLNKTTKMGLINKGISSVIHQGKNVILDSVSKNIEESFTSQLNNIEKLSKYENNWKNYFEKRDFDGMQKEYDKIQQKLKEIMPLENTIKEARQIENIHNLIKNNGHNFDLTNEQLELSKMLV